MLGKIFVRDRETEWRRRTANSGGCPTQGNTTQVPEQDDISDVTGSSPSGPTTSIEIMALWHWDQGIGIPWCIAWRGAYEMLSLPLRSWFYRVRHCGEFRGPPNSERLRQRSYHHHPKVAHIWVAHIHAQRCSLFVHNELGNQACPVLKGSKCSIHDRYGHPYSCEDISLARFFLLSSQIVINNRTKINVGSRL
jgi:hypothetical protein